MQHMAKTRSKQGLLIAHAICSLLSVHEHSRRHQVDYVCLVSILEACQPCFTTLFSYSLATSQRGWDGQQGSL